MGAIKVSRAKPEGISFRGLTGSRRVLRRGGAWLNLYSH